MVVSERVLSEEPDVRTYARALKMMATPTWHHTTSVSTRPTTRRIPFLRLGLTASGFHFPSLPTEVLCICYIDLEQTRHRCSVS